MIIRKIDVIAGIIAGEFIAALFWLVLATAGIETGNTFGGIVLFLRWPIFLALPVLIVSGLFVAEFLSRWWRTLWQVAKFLVVGVLNTLVDLGVFNLLKVTFAVTSAGFLLSTFKGASFAASVINSYIWNKLWVFERKGSRKFGTEFTVFLAVSLMGLFLNTAMFYLLTAVIRKPIPGTVSEAIWHDISVVLAGLAVFIWNFLGYKLIVFRQPPKPPVVTEALTS